MNNPKTLQINIETSSDKEPTLFFEGKRIDPEDLVEFVGEVVCAKLKLQLGHISYRIGKKK